MIGYQKRFVDILMTMDLRLFITMPAGRGFRFVISEVVKRRGFKKVLIVAPRLLHNPWKDHLPDADYEAGRKDFIIDHEIVIVENVWRSPHAAATRRVQQIVEHAPQVIVRNFTDDPLDRRGKFFGLGKVILQPENYITEFLTVDPA